MVAWETIRTGGEALQPQQPDQSPRRQGPRRGAMQTELPRRVVAEWLSKTRHSPATSRKPCRKGWHQDDIPESILGFAMRQDAIKRNPIPNSQPDHTGAVPMHAIATSVVQLVRCPIPRDLHPPSYHRCIYRPAIYLADFNERASISQNNGL